MAKHYTVYWIGREVRRIANSGDHFITYAYGEQLNKIEIGDTLWIVSFLRESGLLLFGKLVCGRRLSRAEAAQEFGELRCMVEAQLELREMFQAIPIGQIAHRLRFVSKHDRLKFNGLQLDPQQLRSVRQLTLESANLLNDIWQQGKSVIGNDAHLGRLVGAGFGDPKTNRLVERAAVDAVCKHYRANGWSVKSVEADKVGYDLYCAKGKLEQHVEVKGIAGKELVFIITDGEKRKALNDPNFILCAVTQALSKPKLFIISGSELNSSYSFMPIAYRVTAR